jgi:pyridoxine 5'-phosphate synthase PdxJ
VANGDLIASLGKANIPMKVNQQLLHIPCFILPNASFPLILGCDFLRARGITLKFRQENVEIRRNDLRNLKETPPIKMYAIDTQVIPAYSQKYIPCVLHNSSDNSLLVAEPNPELYSEKGILIAKSITDSNLLKQYLLVANTTDREVEITNDQYLAEFHDVAHVCQSN